MKNNLKNFLIALVIFIVILIISYSSFYFGFGKQKNNESVETEINQTDQLGDAETQKIIVGKYDIGWSEFSTVIEGYYDGRDFSIESDEKGNPVILGKMAYLVTLNFEDKNFEESYKTHSRGLRYQKEGEYIFPLGLVKDGKIDCTSYVDYKTPCMDDLTNEKILNSTAEKPVKVELFFGVINAPYNDSDAYKIRVVDK